MNADSKGYLFLVKDKKGILLKYLMLTIGMLLYFRKQGDSLVFWLFVSIFFSHLVLDLLEEVSTMKVGN